MQDLLKRHWRSYVAEAGGLAAFVFFAGLTVTLLEYANSPLHRLIHPDLLRHLLLGLVMGVVSMGIIYAPWCKKSGAQINPAVTGALYRMGRISAADAALYILAQFAGAIGAAFLLYGILGEAFARPPVSYGATMPGPGGPVPAFVAELLMTFVLMLMALILGSIKRTEKYVGAVTGGLIALYLTFELPLSGMSLNPARSFAAALAAHQYAALWIYFVAPPLAALLAVELFMRLKAQFAAHPTPPHCGKWRTLLAEMQDGPNYPLEKKPTGA